MGSPGDEPGRGDDEVQHEVTLTRPLWVMETEVTRAQWQAVMGTDPAYFKRADDLPVEQVSWHDAVAFADELSKKEGLSACYTLTDCTEAPDRGQGCSGRDGTCISKYACTVKRLEGCVGYRLPTEAEWEHLTRAGTTGAIYAGPLKILGAFNAPTLDPIAWYGGNSGTQHAEGLESLWPEMQHPAARSATQPVGQKAANPWGLRDTLGNVWEWCEDWHGVDAQAVISQGPGGSRQAEPGETNSDPRGPATGAYRVIRGGSWSTYAQWVRAAQRLRRDPVRRDRSVGFRLVRTPSS